MPQLLGCDANSETSSMGSSLAGAIIAVISFTMGLFFIVRALIFDVVPEGWPSLIVSIFFLGGIRLMGLGAVGEYIGMIYVTMNSVPGSPFGRSVRVARSWSPPGGSFKAIQAAMSMYSAFYVQVMDAAPRSAATRA